MTKTYYVTAITVDRKRQQISKFFNTKSEAVRFAKRIRQDMRKSINKFKWAKKIKVHSHIQK
jgi:hypothetical protein